MCLSDCLTCLWLRCVDDVIDGGAAVTVQEETCERAAESEYPTNRIISSGRHLFFRVEENTYSGPGGVHEGVPRVPVKHTDRMCDWSAPGFTHVL